MEEELHILAQEITNLGRDDKERAKALGVSLRTITDYKAGRFPRIITSLLEKRIVVLRGRIVAKKHGVRATTTTAQPDEGAASVVVL